jgi:hypothetical protein
VVLKQLDDPMLPAAFVAWADQVGINVPAKLRGMVDALGEKAPDWKSLYERLLVTLADKDDIFQALHAMQAKLEAAQAKDRAAKILGAKERHSMFKIIAAVAKKKYRYDLNAGKNSATKNIFDEVRGLGLRIDVATVRKYLEDATHFMVENAEPEG